MNFRRIKKNLIKILRIFEGMKALKACQLGVLPWGSQNIPRPIIKRLIEGLPNLKNIYRVEISGLRGGHSGIDIDKGIPNAIKLLGKFLKGKDINIAKFSGGERINSIPTKAEAIISSKVKIDGIDGVNLELIDTNRTFYMAKDIIDMIDSFKNGVIALNKDLNVVDRSLNLALIDLVDGELKIEISIRGMSDIGIDEVSQNSVEHLNSYGFETRVEDKYPSWEPKVGDFARRVDSKMREVFGNSEFVAIHAGLECGILSKRFLDIEISSIGPTNFISTLYIWKGWYEFGRKDF